MALAIKLLARPVPRRRLGVISLSGDQVVQHVASYIGKAEIAAAVTIGQLQVIDAHQIEDGRVDIVHVNRLLDGLESKLVRGTIDRAAFDSAAREPHRESERIVVPARALEEFEGREQSNVELAYTTSSKVLARWAMAITWPLTFCLPCFFSIQPFPLES